MYTTPWSTLLPGHQVGNGGGKDVLIPTVHGTDVVDAEGKRADPNDMGPILI